MKAALLISLVLLTACAPGSQDKAKSDVKQVEQDVKRGFEKAKDSPATKELTDDAKRGFKKVDKAVTKALEYGRDKVREKVNGTLSSSP